MLKRDRHRPRRDCPTAPPPTIAELVDGCRVELVERGHGGDAVDGVEWRCRVAAQVDEYLSHHPGVDGATQCSLLPRVLDELLGAGPLQPLLADRGVTEILVNGLDAVYVERHGRLSRAAVRFADAEQVRALVERLLAGTGRRCDDGSPLVDARLADGSRLNAVLPPVALGAPQLSLRRPGRVHLTLGDLVDRGALDGGMAAFLHAAVLGRCNLLVTGAAGAGKTTLLGALCDLVPPEQRIVVLEDVAEVTTTHPHVVRQETRPAGREGGDAVTLRRLVVNALRMRPDRLVVGEVRGEEAGEMVRAMATGHDGSMGTLHAGSPVDAIRRLEGLVAMSLPGQSTSAVREWVRQSVDVVVHCSRDGAGRRWVAAVAALDDAADGPEIVTLHRRRDWADPRRTSACGAVPRRCLERMAGYGVCFPPALFAVEGAA